MKINILKYILKRLTELTIWRYKPDIIAITGSVGKTSIKDAIYAVLSSSGKKVRKSGGNLNNELGVSLTILGDWPEKNLELVSLWQPAGEKKIRKFLFWLEVIAFSFLRVIFLPKYFYPKILILEYGADRPGDIKNLLEIAKPKIGVISAIGETPVHIEFYSGLEAIVREKSKLIENMSVNDFAVLNFDDELAMEAKEKTRAKITTFGFDDGANVRIVNFENVNFKIEYQGSVVPVNMKNTFGRPQAYAAGAATCVGLIYGLNLVRICEALSSDYQPAKHRMNLLAGVNGSLVIDDSYNASPISMKAALEALADTKAENGTRKIAVLGDMRELGEHSLKAHKDIGKLAAGIVDFLITAGKEGKIIAESAVLNGLAKDKVLSFDTAEEASKAIKEIIQKGDIILVKASRGIGLDKVVGEIKGPIV